MKAAEQLNYSARTMFDRLSTIIGLAIQAGDYKTAGENQRYLLRCLGYEDHPTMTHSHLATGHLLTPPKPGEGQGEPAPNVVGQGRFAAAREAMRKANEKYRNDALDRRSTP